MVFSLKVIKNKFNKEYFTVDYQTYIYRKSNLDNLDDLKDYNNLFSTIIAANYRNIKYLVSDTLTRIEGRTYFFDKLTKFLQIKGIIDNESNNIHIVNLDPSVCFALIRALKNNNATISCNKLKLLLFHFIEWIKFIIKIVLKISLDIVLLISSRLFSSVIKKTDLDYAFLSFYDHRCLRNGKYNDAYFQPLLDYLKKKDKSYVVFTTPILNEKPWRIFKYLKVLAQYLRQIRKIQKEARLALCMRYISLQDLLRSYYNGLMSRLKIKERIIFQGQDISYLVNLFLKEDYLRAYWNYAYQQYYFTKNVLRSFRIEEIIYPYENHPWEKLLVRARNEQGSALRLVAFQHTSLSLKLLQYFPGRFEANLPIFPDKILTVGEILRDVMTSFGSYRTGLVEVGAALRHPYLFDGKKYSNKKGFNKKIAYAFSFDTKVYPIIINSLLEVFKDTNFIVYLKIHPIVPVENVIKSDLPGNFVIAKHMNWQNLFQDIDLLFYDDNSLGIEALKYDVDVVYFGIANQIYNSDRLFNFPDEKFAVHNVQGLKDFIANYYSREKRHINSAEQIRENYLLSYFCPITDERLERFLSV